MPKVTRKIKQQIACLLLSLQLFLTFFLPFSVFVPQVLAQEPTNTINQLSDELALDLTDSYAVYYVVDGQIFAEQAGDNNNVSLNFASGEDLISYDANYLVIKTTEQTYWLKDYQLANTYNSDQLTLMVEDETFLRNQWQITDQVAETLYPVVAGLDYAFPLDETVKVRFTELPEETSTLRIERVLLTEELQAELGAVSSYAYDITTDMADGEFAFDLILPKNTEAEDKDLELKYAESLDELTSQAQVVETELKQEGDVVKAENIDHMTIFVVTFEDPQNPTPSDPGYNDLWFDYAGGQIYQVSSGTNGIISAEGNYHSEITGPVFTRWGGFSNTFPTNGYDTKLDVYLDMALADGSTLNFDFSSAIGTPSGDHRRDFIISLGTDSSNPGQWLASASNNSPGWPGNPARNPAHITESGWYTIEHSFRANSSGVLEVTISLYKKGSTNPVGSWLLSDPSDVIGVTVGGNRYGWFPNFDFSWLAIDNTILDEVDVTAPTVTVTTPDGDLFNNDQILIQGTAYDGGSGIDKVQMHIANTSTGLVVGCTTLNAVVSGNDWSLDLAGVSSCNLTTDGEYEIRAWAYDQAGNPGWAARNKFYIDTTKPTGKITTPTDGSLVIKSGSNFIVNVEGWASDANGIDPSSIQIKVRESGNTSNATAWAPASFDGYNFSGSVDVSSLSEGTYEVAVKVTDLAGNTKWLWPRPTIILDKTAPSVPVLTWPVGGVYTNDNTPLMQWDDSSDNIGVKGYFYRIYYNCSDVNDSSTCTAVYPNSTGKFLNNSQYQAGVTADNVYYWQVRAEDQAGNQSAWSALEKVVIDTTAPEVPFGIYFKDTVNNKIISCGSRTNTNHIDVYWNNIINDSTFSHFEYSSFDAPNGSAGLVERRFDTNYFGSSWWTIPMEGVYGVQLRSVDLAGNKSAWTGGAVGIDYSCQYIVDWTAPAIPALDSPTDGFQTQGVAFDQSWYPVSDASGYEYQSCHVDPGDLGADCINIRWTQTFDGVNNVVKHVGAGQSDGKFWWRVRSKDAAGNFSSWSESREIIIDNTAPTSTITTPNITNGRTLITNNWDGYLAGTASDVNGIDHVELSIDDGNTVQTVTANGQENWDYTLSNPQTGSYTITSHAVDQAGNIENSYTVTIILDKTIPEVSLTVNPTNPDGDNAWYLTRPEVTLTATDTFYGMGHIKYQWDSQTGTWLTYTTPLVIPSEGQHVLYYRAWDQAGNHTDIGVKVLKWDQTELSAGPFDLSADPNPTGGDTSTISWSAATDDQGINKYEVLWRLAGVQHVKTVAGDVLSTEIDQLTEGDWRVIVRAFDGAGHSLEASITLVVDRTAPAAPTLTLGDTREGEVDLSWTAIADADRYIIYYGLTSGDYLYAADVGNVTSFTVQGLTAGDYYFVVRAVDSSDNQSANSNEVSILGLTGAAGGVIAQGFQPAGEVQGETTEASPEEQQQMAEEIVHQGEVKGTNITCTWWKTSLFWVLLVVQAAMVLLAAKFSRRSWLKLLSWLLLPAILALALKQINIADCYQQQTMAWLASHYYMPTYLAAIFARLLGLFFIDET